MKKSIIALTSLSLLCFVMLGCTKADPTLTTSKELNKNLNILSNTINRLDSINNEYLVNNDLYSINKLSNMPTPRKAEATRLASSKNVIKYI